MKALRIEGLNDRYAVVTGSTRGIGRAIVESLATYGVNVIITSRSQQDAASAARQVSKRHGVEALGYRADVSSLEDVRGLFDAALKWSGGELDILVNNAGFPFQPEKWERPLHEIPWSDLDREFDDVYATDVRGSRYCTRATLPTMMKKRGGSIIYIASTPALSGYKGTPYTEAKAALIGRTKDLAREYGRYSIRVNSVAYGSMATEATWKKTPPKEKRALIAETALKRVGNPEKDAAGAIVFLAADSLSGFVTGQTLVVDGGVVMY